MKNAYFFILLLSFYALINISNQVEAKNLQESVRKAMEFNPEIQQRTQNEQVQQYLKTKNFLNILPTVSLQSGIGSESTNNPSSRAITGGSDLELTRKESIISLHQNLFGEGNIQNYKAQKANLRLSRSQTMEIREFIALATAEAYLDVLRYREISKIYSTSVESFKEMLTRIIKRSRSGFGKLSEESLTRGRIALAEANLVSSISQLREAESTYKKFTSLKADQKMALPKFPKAIPKSFETAWKQAVVKNPTLEAKKHEISASEAERKTNLLATMPSISIDAQASAGKNIDGIIGHTDDMKVMLNLNYTFGSGSRIYQSKASKAVVRQKHYELKDAKNNLHHNLLSSFIRYKSSKDRHVLITQHKKFTKDVVTNYNKEFNAGYRSLFDLLNAENEFYNASVARTNSLYDQYINSYEILANIGILSEYIMTK